ncbi:MarR family winged helix-turn-helix transcriptional regulator [Streptomyces sp. NBC_01262]|uniref:MarR family winged helix-turn-helix transcriptional regulator n=1 Tax=Streptomyces sp. NBC_01262 TaxID=2903803 RepID=UPI002E2F5310|nr:MarR family transcriptional regulator [Streptomyces sp. NBC_01262]
MESRATAADTDETTGQLADQLLRLTKRLRRAHSLRLAPVGITPAQAHVLRILGHTQRHGEQPPRMADLAERLDVVPRAVTTLVDALEEAGYASRTQDPTNRRVMRVTLTDAGGDVLAGLRRARREAAEELLAPLDAAQRESLTALLAVLDTAPGRC